MATRKTGSTGKATDGVLSAKKPAKKAPVKKAPAKTAPAKKAPAKKTAAPSPAPSPKPAPRPGASAARRSAGGSFVEGTVRLDDTRLPELVVEVREGKSLKTLTLAQFIGNPVDGMGGLFRPTLGMSTDGAERQQQVERLQGFLVDFLKTFGDQVALVAHCKSCNNRPPPPPPKSPPKPPAKAASKRKG